MRQIVAGPLPRVRMARLCVRVLLVATLGVPVVADATAGAYRESPHGNRATGVLRGTVARRGDCTNCHGTPRDPRARGGSAPAKAPFVSGGNDGCTSCHGTPVRARSWLGAEAYRVSGHATSPVMVWPGPVPPARASADAGKCVNCHDPHGAKDRAGLVPALLRVRGPALCFRCHDGTVASDVAAAFSRPYRHPLVAAGPTATASAAAGPPTSGAAQPGTSEPETCGGCHNPHAAAPERDRSFSTTASALAGVRRVRVGNGPAGSTLPAVEVAAGDTGPVREHEVCLRCHSGQVPGAVRSTADLGAALNPNNASFHPVEARGKNATLDPRTFAQGWSADRLVRCSDCHASDGADGRGPHGSAYPHILKKRYPAGTAQAPVSAADLCFECHRYATYADPGAGAAAALSAFGGHASHSAKGFSCWACHDAHGSAELPGLLVLRTPGLTAYARDPTGTSCSSTCHTATARVVTTRKARR